MAQDLEFPVTAHHCVIVYNEQKDFEVTCKLFDSFDLLEPITELRKSSGGKYASLSISVNFKDAGEMARFDEQLKLIPGIKMVL
jgi:putative lipoic acid-binding regulatory protein